jgi:hypothetical protein
VRDRQRHTEGDREADKETERYTQINKIKGEKGDITTGSKEIQMITRECLEKMDKFLEMYTYIYISMCVNIYIYVYVHVYICDLS